MLYHSNGLQVRVIGSGQHCWDIVGFLRDEGIAVEQVTIEQARLDPAPKNYQYILGILRDVRERINLTEWMMSNNLHSPVYIHSTSWAACPDRIKGGTVVFPMSAVLNSDIHEHCVISTFCNVAHNCILHTGAMLYPYSCLLGSADIGSYSVLQTRSTVNTHVVMADFTNLLPNAFLTKSTPDAGTWGGVPARRINSNNTLTSEFFLG
jgi:carbonic anhydrase/acetyltransferase-like protein (isoleucine patch superfamily)